MDTIRIPGYETLDRIGEGGMAFVFRARQLSLGRMVAIKVLRPELVSDPTAMAQFRLEANSVANLKHPNILQVHEAGDVDGLPYFVMEYVSAYSVQAWLSRSGRLSEEDTLIVADSVACALAYAWEKGGLYHGDLKPGNVLVDEDGHIKVADFSGLGRDRSGADARRVAEMTIGTPNYMAPEQVHGIEDLDARVDIYALGAMMYQLLTGQLPFGDAPTEADAMRRQIEDSLPDPRRLEPEISPNTVHLLERMLARDRTQRHGDWEALREDLARVRAGRPPMGHPPPAGGSTLARDPDPPDRKMPDAPAPVRRPRVVMRLPHDAPPAAPPAPRARRRGPIVGWVVLAIGLLLLSLHLLGILPSDRWTATTEPEPAPDPAPIVPIPEQPAPPEPPAMPPTEDPDVGEIEDPMPPPTEIREPAAEPVPDPEVPVPEPGGDAEAFAALLEAMRNATVPAQDRQFAQAERLLRNWAADHRENPHADLARADAARFASATGLWRLLEQKAATLLGAEIATGAGGTVVAVSREGVRVRRQLGMGTADTEVAWTRLTDEDLQGLIRRADPAQAARNLALLALAQARMPTAETALAEADARGLDTRDLRAWQAEWTARLREITALRAFREAQHLVVASRYAEARTRLDLLQQRLADTEIVQRHYAGEMNEMVSIVAAAETEVPDDPAPALLPPDDPEPDAEPAGEDFVAVDLAELARNMQAYHGRRIRLRFQFRTPITPTGPGTHRCQLGTSEGMVDVEFPEEGMRFLRDVPVLSARAPRRAVFGLVDAERGVVVLIGRTRHTPIGPHSVEYRW